MNKVFRVIWSQATQSWVAVSELTKAHKKQSSSSAKKSASGSSANLIKSSAIALSLLSGSAAYAAEAASGLIQINSTGGAATANGSDAIAIGKDSQATGNDGIAVGREAETTSNDAMALGHKAKAKNTNAVAIGKDSKAIGATSVALGAGSNATGNDSYAIGYGSNASANTSISIGNNSAASSNDSIALGSSTQATGDSAVAIGKGSKASRNNSIALGRQAETSTTFNNAMALGWKSKALGATSVALGAGSNAIGNDSYALGYGSNAIAEFSMALGNSSKASKINDIAFGKGAETRDKGSNGYSIAIGAGAVSGTDKAGLSRSGNDAGSVAIGTGAYTGLNKTNLSVNSSVALGAGAGVGYRKVDADGLPTDNGTDADTNAEVLVKAFGGTKSTLSNFNNSGTAAKDGFFSFQGVNINEGTALGRNTRAIGDQSVAIGAQSVAGQGSIVIGGNDIQAYDKKKYFKAKNPDSKDAKGVNDFDAETTPGTGKNGQPITITKKYEELVGAALDNSYRSSYGQDGSTVIGMQAHSTTPLGVAIGTNSIVRKGAFGATAIGSGASVLANAEAAVAIGMGSEAQGNYAVAAGTAARAEESAVAVGYSSKAAVSSVAVGKGAVSEQVSDIAIGQGAVASGKQGAIAMGLGTIAQGHSSIMIGGSDISTAADQVVSYSREKMNKDGTPELYDGKITEVINGKTVTRTVKLVQTETVMGKKLSDAYSEITGYYLNTLPLDYSIPDNKNGHASISMGIHSLSKGAMGVAIGTGARADALGSMALGTGAHAGMQNSVAIGTGAVADKVSKGTRQTDISYDEDGNVVETGSAKAKYTFRWAGGINTSEGDVVSFGTPGAERQLKNVAAGRVAEDSTDAVNGSQLNAITRSLSQTITNGWQVGGNNKFRMSNIGSNDRVNFLDGLGTAVNIAEINQAEDIEGHKLVKIGSDFYKASDFNDKGELNAGAQKVAAAEIKKQPAGANVTFDVKEVNSTLSVNSVGLKVTTGEVTANSDGTMNTPNNTTKAKNATVTTAMNNAEGALLTSQGVWREKNDAYQRTELAYLAAETALTKGKEAVEAIQADIVTTQKELKTAQDTLATDKAALTRAENEVQRNPNDTQKQSELNQAKEKVGGSQFVVDQRTQKLAHQQETLKDRQNQVSVLEKEKTNAETARNTAKGDYEVANSDLTKKKEAFDTAKKDFVAAGANQIATVQNVADSINASGWTLQQGTSDKDLVQPGDKVAFVDGDGTIASVENKDGKTSTVKYSVNTTTITADTANAGKVKAEGTGNTFATAETVASAINDAYWKATASGNGATTDVADNVKAGDTVTFKAGKNLTVTHNNTNKSFEFATTDTPEFSSVQFGNNGPKITNDGNTIKVSGANGTDSVKITNVADGKDDNDAVNVSQLKASGWNIAGNGKTKVDTINKDDQVNFLDGSGTTVTVEKDKGANGKENGNVNVKYDVNVGNGLQKDTAGNTISVKPADKSLEVTNEGVKVKAADNTLTTDTNGLKVNTGNITASSVPTVADADKDKIATVGNVADAIKAAAWKATSAATTSGENTGKKEQEVKAGDTVTFEADKNIKITQVEGKFTFATKDDVKFDSVQLGGDSGPKLTKADGNDLKVSGSNGTDPVKITNVADGNISADSKDAINGSQFNAVANNNIKLGGDDASETNGQNLNKAGGLKFNINGADGIETKASGDSVTVKINTETKAKIDSVDNKADKNLSNITADGETKIKNLVTWKAKASNSGDELAEGDKTADSDTDAQQVGADGVLTLDAGKNLLLKRSEKTFTYALSKTLSDLTSAEFKKGDVTTKIDGDGLTIQAPTLAGGTAPKAITINKDGISAGDKAIKDVNSGLTNYGGTDAKKDLINLGDPITGSKVPDNNAATVGDLRNMGWVVSSDNTTDNTKAPYSEAVKNADEVKFVGKNAAKVSGKTENGVRTITVDVEVPSVETAKITQNTDGSVTGPAGETLTKALKDAKDELAKLPKNADPAIVQAAKDKVDEAQKAIDNSPNGNKVATAQNVADMINNSGFTLKTSEAEGGKKDTASTGDEVINPGKAVEMIAGKNLTVKQEANGKVTYSLNPELTNLTSAEFKGTGKNAPTTKLTNDGVTITPKTAGKNLVSLTQNGLNNGGNAITNVAGNLDGAKTGTTAPTTSATKPTLGTADNEVNSNNAATVGDVLNAGWNLQGNNAAKDFVTAYDTVNFIDGDGTTVSVENTDNKTSKIKYSVNLGDGLEKTDDNKIRAKAGKGVTVDSDGINVNAGKGLKIDADDGSKVAVNTDDTTITVGDDGKVKAVTGSIEAVTDTKGTGEKAGQVRPVAADKGKLATVDAVANAVNSAKWMAKATNTDAEIADNEKTNDGTKAGEGIAAGDEVTFTAGKNLRVKRDGKNFTFATDKDVSFDSVKVGAEDTAANGKKPVNLTTDKATDASNNDAANKPTTALNISSGTGKDAKPTQLVGVGSVLNKTTINTTPTGTVPAGTTPAYLVNLNETVNKNAAATVGDLQNMGWKVSSDKTTGADGAYLDVVKNANEVRFVGEGAAVVSGKTDDKGVRTITVKVDDQVSTNNAVTPVVYTKADGTKVYPVKNAQGKIEYHTTPDGKGEGDEKVDDGDVITSVNGPKGTTKPTTLSNVAGNLNGAKTGTNAPTTNAAAPNTTDATKPNYVNTHNAATVGDVLNAGWNLQNNGTAKDFVKPFDTVNFVNGGNTTAVVTTKADGTTSDVTFNVTGLPIATTIATPDGPVQLTKVGDNYYPVKADGTPDIKTDTDGNPTNGYVKADNGKYYPASDVTFTKNPDTNVTTVTPKEGKKPVTFGNSLTNPNVVNTTDAPNNAVTAPTTLNNVKNNIPAVNDADKKVTNADGTDKPNAGDVANINKAPLTAKEAADLLKPMKDGKANPNFVGNNAATVSDVLNAGWNLQNNGAAKDFVKPYDTVNFRDGGNTTVTVTTDDNLTSHVQVNVTGLPVSNTITDPATGKQVPVVKVGDAFYRTNPDGTPNIERNDEGEPTNGYVRANDGKLYPRDAVEVTPNAADPTQPPTITPKADAKPTTVNTNLVNPNVDNTTDNPGNNVNTPNQLGNVANGAKTFNAVDADGKDYVKANNGKYYEPSKVNADGSLKDGTDATADAKNPLVLANDGKWYPADKVSDKGTPEAGATAVENPLAPKNAAGQPLVRAKDGKWYTPADVQPNGLPTPTAQPQDNAINNKAGLVDFANSNPNNAATIGDLQNMGWVVSAPGNSYSDQVRNANEVQFVGEGTAIVTGKTDDKGVRTITVKVDNQVSTNNSVTPVVYTDKNGNTVYPIKDDKGNVAYHTTPDGKGKGDTVVPNGDVNTSVNGPKDEQGNTRPASLGNVKNNIPAVNDVDKKVTNPDGTEKGTAGDVNNINKAPLTATEAADLLNPRKDGKPNPNFVGNNAATVSDVLNAGWNLQNNGTAKDFVKPYDTVNFINGLGTTAVVTTREGNTTSDVTFNVKAANGSVTVDEDGVKVTTGEMKPAVDANNKETGAIATSANPATAKQLKDALDAAVKELATAKDALKTAEKALEANPKDPALQQAVADKKAEVAAKQTPVDAAQKAHDEAGLNKVATVQNVAEAINNAGFNLTTSAATGGEKLKGAKNDGELIKPSNTVEMVAGKNLTVKQDDKGKITYATKDDVTFTNVNTGTLNVGSPNTYTDGKGNTYTKVGDNYYNPADVENGAPKPDATPVTIPADVVVKPVSPVTMKTEAAKPAKNNATDAQPSSALNITSKDGKPTQITGVGSTLNTNVVKTSPEGTPTTPGAAPKTEDAHLVDLKGTDAVPVNKNAAATVGDLQNMGWVVSTKDGNGYTDVVKNANKVDFKGGAGISVKGETTKDGVREITISVKDGEVVKPNQFTAKVNGTDTPVTKVGDQYYNTADIDPKTGNPKDNVTPVTPDKGTTPTNAGDGYVTGNKVAAAIQKSGFIVGKQTEKLSAADFNDKDEKVNPDDELRFADGNNTKVKLATKVSVDKDGNKVTTTTVKVDVTGLPVQYTDKNGTRVTKVGNQYFTVDDKGNPTATEVKPEDLTTNMVNPAAAPNVIGAPTTLGNVEGNLDGAKTGTTAPTDSHAAPNTADATKPNYVNTHNAATVGDVLNAGWNLQNNGKAKDFVKPYDTVNFVDGKGTKAVVETADNLTSTVKFDVDAGKITADTTKPGAVKGPADETLTKALKDAKDALAKLPKDADAATVKAAQDKVDAAQKAIDDSPNSNKVATAQNVADMINNSGFTLKADKTKGDNSTAADLANGEMIHPGDTITMKAGKNMSVKHEKNGSITYETKDDVNFNSLSLGDSKHAPTLSADEDGSLRLGSKNNQAPVRISNVAPGIKDGDAVNVSQLKGVTKDLEDKIDGVAAGSNAAASLPQVYLPGKSMVAASVGTYGSQGALAVGYSSISDNGKWLIKGQVNVNTKAKTGGGIGIGYLW